MKEERLFDYIPMRRAHDYKDAMNNHKKAIRFIKQRKYKTLEY